MFKLAGDARVTRVGRFLRRSRSTSSPRLWNVLRGDMSLVGPRPPIPTRSELPGALVRALLVKPGVTGLWQVSGRSEVSLEEMIALDVDYVRRRSVLLEPWILLQDSAVYRSG